jgi:hypothetical protein
MLVSVGGENTNFLLWGGKLFWGDCNIDRPVCRCGREGEEFQSLTICISGEDASLQLMSEDGSLQLMSGTISLWDRRHVIVAVRGFMVAV